MAHVGDRDARLLVDRLLEGEDGEHVVDGALDLVDALAPPRPDGRAHVVHGADALRAQLRLEGEVEVGRVHTDEDIGPVLDEALRELLA
jgi:hypothetical protein